MTVKMAKTAAYSITAEISGGMMPGFLRNGCPLPYGHGQYCGIDEGKTLAPAKAGVALKSGIVYKWSKAVFEKYFLWKIKHGLSNLP